MQSVLPTVPCGARQVHRCNIAARGVQVALQLLERFPAVRIYCLVGGLIAWFNEGHDLEDDNGTPVAALHPHMAELEHFILREKRVLVMTRLPICAKGSGSKGCC